MENGNCFIIYLDFLGFSEASKKIDTTTRKKVLELLLSIANLSGEFFFRSIEGEGGSRTLNYRPAISTFSDHIIISYPFEAFKKYLNNAPNSDEFVIELMIDNALRYISLIARKALEIGFLIRGGATVGDLHHENNVVFGEALIEAYEIESKISIYPRIVLSKKLMMIFTKVHRLEILRSEDGLYHFNYFFYLLRDSGTPGNNFTNQINTWFTNGTAVINKNLTDANMDLKNLSKWTWFANEFRIALERLNPRILEALNISLQSITNWPKNILHKEYT